MTRLEFLEDQKTRCLKWLDTPERELPGTLTHEKVLDLLQETEDELLDHAGIQVSPEGAKLVYREFDCEE